MRKASTAVNFEKESYSDERFSDSEDSNGTAGISNTVTYKNLPRRLPRSMSVTVQEKEERRKMKGKRKADELLTREEASNGLKSRRIDVDDDNTANAAGPSNSSIFHEVCTRTLLRSRN